MNYAACPEAPRRPVYLLFALVLSGMLLVGCGKKGPLYMPDKKPAAPAEVPVQVPAQVPAPALTDSLQP